MIGTRTHGPWNVTEHIVEHRHGCAAGYIAITGPNGEGVAHLFPFGRKGVGLENARANALFIVALLSDFEARLQDERAEAPE